MSIITRVISTFGPRSPVRDIPPTPPFAQEEGAEVAIFALGPFHSAELLFVQNFSHRGLRASTVGYIGGRSSGGGAPSYSRVLSGASGHALAVRLEYDPNQISYAALVDFFYRIHDPTKRNAQGPDKGTHYRSAIFCLTPEQRDIARRITGEVQKIRFTPKGHTIVTKLVGPSEEQGGVPDWYDAEEEHQKYHFLYPDAPRCPTHKMHW